MSLCNRSKKGTSIVEFAAVLVLGLPLLIGLIYFCLELTHFFAIKSAMDVGARNTARALAVRFNDTSERNAPEDSTCTGCSLTPNLQVLSIPQYITNGNQYAVTWDTANNPPTFVQVSCTYPHGGSSTLPPFPNGPINYFNAQFNLANFDVTSNFTMPIQ